MVKKIKVPESVCDFTEEEQGYVSRCQKMFRFYIDLQKAVIMIPTDEVLTDEEDLICQHLYGRMGIDVERSDDARILKCTVHKTRTLVPKKVESVFDIMTLVKKGLKFSDTRKGLNHEIVKEVGTKWECRILNSMQANWAMSKDSFEVGLKNGIFIIKDLESGK